jgi:hypothetical protein
MLVRLLHSIPKLKIFASIFLLAGITLSSINTMAFPSRTQPASCGTVFDYHVRITKEAGPSDADHMIDQYRSILVDTQKYQEVSFYFFQLPQPVTYLELDQMMADPIKEMEIYGDPQIKILLAADHKTVAVVSSTGLTHEILSKNLKPKLPGVESLGGSRMEYGTRLINSRHFSYDDGVRVHMEYFGSIIQFQPPIHLDSKTTTATYLFHQEMEARQQARVQARAEASKINNTEMPAEEKSSSVPTQTELNHQERTSNTKTGLISRMKAWLERFR